MKFSGLRVVSVGKLLVPEWSRNIPPGEGPGIR